MFCVCETLDRVCSGCKKNINEELGIYSYSLFKNFRELGIYHNYCKNKISSKALYQETGVFFFTDKLVSGAVPVIFSYKGVVQTKNNMTVFDAVDLPSESVVDKTVYAGRESLEGASVGLIDEKRFEELEQPVDIDDFFLQVKGSKPLIEETKTKRITK